MKRRDFRTMCQALGAGFLLLALPAAAERGITLYEHKNFVGRSETFHQDVASLKGSALGQDEATSVRIDPGCRAVLYRHIDFGGRSLGITADVANLKDTRLGNDEVSSLQVRCEAGPFPESTPVNVAQTQRPVPVPPPAGALPPRDASGRARRGVTLFEDGDFGGRSESFYDDDPSLLDNRIGQNSASSVRIDSGCRVVLYKNTQYQGESSILTQDMANLRDSRVGNDDVSSLQILCASESAVPAAPAVRQGPISEEERWLLAYRQLVASVLGPKHPDVAFAEDALGDFYGQEGRLGEAAQVYQRSQKLRENAYGTSRPVLLKSYYRLATLAFRADRTKEGELHLNAARSMDRGDTEPRWRRAAELARTARQYYAQAQEVADKISRFKSNQPSFGHDHPYVRELEEEHAELDGRRQAAEEALIPLSRDLVEGARADSFSRAATLRLEQGDSRHALEEARRATAIYRGRIACADAAERQRFREHFELHLKLVRGGGPEREEVDGLIHLARSDDPGNVVQDSVGDSASELAGLRRERSLVRQETARLEDEWIRYQQEVAVNPPPRVPYRYTQVTGPYKGLSSAQAAVVMRQEAYQSAIAFYKTRGELLDEWLAQADGGAAAAVYRVWLGGSTRDDRLREALPYLPDLHKPLTLLNMSIEETLRIDGVIWFQVVAGAFESVELAEEICTTLDEAEYPSCIIFSDRIAPFSPDIFNESAVLRFIAMVRKIRNLGGIYTSEEERGCSWDLDEETVARVAEESGFHDLARARETCSRIVHAQRAVAKDIYQVRLEIARKEFKPSTGMSWDAPFGIPMIPWEGKAPGEISEVEKAVVKPYQSVLEAVFMDPPISWGDTGIVAAED